MRLIPNRRFVAWTLASGLLLHAMPASAQQTTSLKISTIAFAAAASADWIDTYYGVSTHSFQESTPGIRRLQAHPGLMVAAGAAEDIGLAILWHRAVGRRHPKLATAGLWVATGFRVYLCAKGVGILNQRN